MTNFEFYFFFAYLIFQILIPLRRHFATYLVKRGKSDILADHASYFSWDLSWCSRVGVATFVVFNENGNQLYRSKISNVNPEWRFGELALFKKQIAHLAIRPRSMIQFVKFLEAYLKEQHLKDFGVRVESEININERGFVEQTDPYADLCKEKIKMFGRYQWYLGSQ